MTGPFRRISIKNPNNLTTDVQVFLDLSNYPSVKVEGAYDFHTNEEIPVTPAMQALAEVKMRQEMVMMAQLREI